MKTQRQGDRGQALASADPEELLALARQLEPLVEGLVTRVFAAHKEELLSADITYIVPAVWGVSNEGRLTDAQREIHAQVAEALERVFELLGLDGLSRQQDYALRYLVRSLIIAKVTFMIEGAKNIIRRRADQAAAAGGRLASLEPVGSA